MPKPRAFSSELEIGLDRQSSRGCDENTGDLSHLMPMVEVKSGGFHGYLHTASHMVADEELACLVPAKAMAMTAVDLLADGATTAKAILANFTPKMTKAQYLAFLRSFA